MNKKQRWILMGLAAAFTILFGIGLWSDRGLQVVETNDLAGQVIFSREFDSLTT